MTPPFSRTVCACESCVAPCRTMPGALAPGDAERIAAQLGQPYGPEFLEKHFQASQGSLVGKRLPSGDVQTFRIPSLVPKLTASGCTFLNSAENGGDNKCTIHEVAPFGCAYCDMHMTREAGDERSKWLNLEILKSHMQGGEYRQAVQFLYSIGNIAPPLSERRTNLEAQLQACHERGGITHVMNDGVFEQTLTAI